MIVLLGRAGLLGLSSVSYVMEAKEERRSVRAASKHALLRTTLTKTDHILPCELNAQQGGGFQLSLQLSNFVHVFLPSSLPLSLTSTVLPRRGHHSRSYSTHFPYCLRLASSPTLSPSLPPSLPDHPTVTAATAIIQSSFLSPMAGRAMPLEARIPPR